MSKQIEFIYDYGSPTAYLAWTQLPGIAERTGAEIVWNPVLLGGIFKAAGNHTPVEIKAKAAWMMDDMQRWADRYGVPYAMNPHFIINTMAVMRGACYALREGFIERYNDVVFKAVWVAGSDMGDPEIIRTVLGDAGLDVDGIFAGAQSQEIKDDLKARTEDAAARGVFGAPSFFVDGTLHFGNDRLDFVEEAAKAA